jgi:hypothetical protein
VKIQDDPENARLPIPTENFSGILIVKEIFIHHIIAGAKFSILESFIVALIISLSPMLLELKYYSIKNFSPEIYCCFFSLNICLTIMVLHFTAYMQSIDVFM